MFLSTGRSFLYIVRKLLVPPLVLGLMLFLNASIHDGYTTSFTSTQSGSQNDSGTPVVATVPVGLSPHDLVYDGGNGDVFVTKEANTISESVTNAKASTSVAMSCSPSSINVGRFTICNANVTGLSPTGSVTFSKSSSTGTFASPYAVCGNNCPGTYHTSYTDTATSSITVSITASYSATLTTTPALEHSLSALPDQQESLQLAWGNGILAWVESVVGSLQTRARPRAFPSPSPARLSPLGCQ